MVGTLATKILVGCVTVSVKSISNNGIDCVFGKLCSF